MAQAIRVAAVFKDTNVVKEVFPSFSAAKKATKGEDGVVLVKEGTPEAQVIQFPPRSENEAKQKGTEAKSTAGSPTNVTIKGELTGPYTWVGAPRNRLLPTDPRCVYHNALAANTSFEDYLAATSDTPKVVVSTTRGGTKTDTPVTYAKYAARCGWLEVAGFDRLALKKAAERGEYVSRTKKVAENGGDDNNDAGGVDTPDQEESSEVIED